MSEVQGKAEHAVWEQDRDASQEWMRREIKGLKEGQVVIKGKQKPFELRRQGHIRPMSMPGMTHTASDNMLIFVHNIPVRSGRHIHQGGLAIFVVAGKGYTVVDGVRNDWEEGDLILLPLKPGGAEHQHFNVDPQKPARWVALQCRPLREMYGRPHEQKEDSPDWQETDGKG